MLATTVITVSLSPWQVMSIALGWVAASIPVCLLMGRVLRSNGELHEELAAISEQGETAEPVEPGAKVPEDWFAGRFESQPIVNQVRESVAREVLDVVIDWLQNTNTVEDEPSQEMVQAKETVH